MTDLLSRDLTMHIPRPDKHPIRFFLAKLYSLPKTLVDDKSKKQYFCETVCKSIQDSLALGFSVQQYIQRISQGFIGPDGRHLSCAPRLLIPYEAGLDKMSLLNIEVEQSQGMMRCLTTWPIRLHGLESSKSCHINLNTLHDLAQAETAQSSGSSANSTSGDQAGSIANVSTQESDLVHSVTRMHKSVRDSLGDVSEENVLTEKMHSACQMSYQVADADPHLDRLLRTHIAIKEAEAPRGQKSLANATLTRPRYEQDKGIHVNGLNSPTGQEVYIAIGSNLGNRLQNIESACDKMTEKDIIVVRTSALYETRPMYLEDQDLFLNCVCQVRNGLYSYEMVKRLSMVRIGQNFSFASSAT